MNCRGRRIGKSVKREDEVEGREIGKRVDYGTSDQRLANNCDKRREK